MKRTSSKIETLIQHRNIDFVLLGYTDVAMEHFTPLDSSKDSEEGVACVI
jgi:hypothetical protein